MKEYNDKNYDGVMEDLSKLKNNIDSDIIRTRYWYEKNKNCIQSDKK